MPAEFGVVGLGAVAAVAIVVLVAAVLFLRSRLSRQPASSQRSKPAFSGESRLEVLDVTEVDEERRLVLVRCDGIEHLIMTGGPSDLVVENDVRRARGGDRSSAGLASNRDRAAS